MKNTLFKNILYRNIILSIIAFSFTIGIGMIFFYHFTYRNIQNNNQRVANIVALRIDNFMALAIERALFISKDRNLLKGDNTPILKYDFKVAGVYDSISVLNNRGEMVSSFPHKETFNKKEILQILSRDFSYSLQSINKHIVIFTPIKDTKGNIKMLLAYNIEKENSKFFNKLLLQTKDKFGGKGYIVDSKGQIVFDYDKAKLNKYFPIERFTITKENIHEDILNPFITTIAEVPKTQWYTVVETPLKNVLKPLYEFTFIIILIFVCLFMLYNFLSYHSLKRTLKPIKDLISEMTVFSKLDYYQPLSVKGIGEVEYLYEAYNTMVKRLKNAWEIEQETFEELKRAEKLSVVGELAAGSAHEIRNPLTTIKGFIQLYYDNGNRISTEHKELIFSELEHIEQITNEFLMLAKPQMNIYRNYMVQDIIDEVCMMIENDAVINNVRIVNKVKCHCEIYCDVPQIKQVFINISRNAIQAMTKSGGELTIECKEDKINNGSYIIFTDSGTGIPNENIDKLGQPFFTTKADGTGLGLTVTYRIIQNHQGSISVNSSSKGTIFTIWLPRK